MLALLVGVVALISIVPGATAAASLFPERPSTGIETLTGVLIDDGVGADAGGFDLGRTTVVVRYWRATLNGKSVFASNQIDVSRS